MQAFVLNRHGRMVFPSNVIPEQARRYRRIMTSSPSSSSGQNVSRAEGQIATAAAGAG